MRCRRAHGAGGAFGVPRGLVAKEGSSHVQRLSALRMHRSEPFCVSRSVQPPLRQPRVLIAERVDPARRPKQPLTPLAPPPHKRGQSHDAMAMRGQESIMQAARAAIGASDSRQSKGILVSSDEKREVAKQMVRFLKPVRAATKSTQVPQANQALRNLEAARVNAAKVTGSTAAAAVSECMLSRVREAAIPATAVPANDGIVMLASDSTPASAIPSTCTTSSGIQRPCAPRTRAAKSSHAMIEPSRTSLPSRWAPASLSSSPWRHAMIGPPRTSPPSRRPPGSLSSSPWRELESQLVITTQLIREQQSVLESHAIAVESCMQQVNQAYGKAAPRPLVPARFSPCRARVSAKGMLSSGQQQCTRVG